MLNSKRKPALLQLKLLPGVLAAGLLMLTLMADAAQDNRPAGTPATESVFKSLTKKELAWLRDHPVIRVVQDPDWPPVEFADEYGEPSGMTAEYLNIVEQRLGIRFERVLNLSWQDAYSSLKRREIDMTTSVAVTPERSEFLAFTRPYMKIPIVIVVHSDVTYIADMRELAEKNIAVVDGYAVNDWIPKDYPDISLVRVKTVQEGLELLQHKEVFAFVQDMLTVGYYLAKLNMTNLKIAGETPYENAQCMAVRKDWAPFAGILQKVLDSIPMEEHTKIYRKWLPIHYEHRFNYTLFWQVLAVFTMIFLLMLFWNRKLAGEIKSRKEAEAALKESETKFKNVFEHASIGKSLTAIDGTIYTNHTLCSMLGYSMEELNSLKWQEITHPDDIELTQEKIDSLLRGETESFRLQKRYIHKNGTIIWTDTSAYLQRDNAGKPVYFITSINDITGLKQTEKKLKTAHDRLDTITSSNVIGIVIGDIYGKTIETNDYCLNMLGYTREEFEAGAVQRDKITPQEYHQHDQKVIEEIREHGICTPYEKEYFRKDGSRIWVQLVDVLFREPEERIFAIIIDITERKNTEKALRESESFIKAVLDNLPIGIAVNSVSPSIKFNYMNNNFPRFYRTTREKLTYTDAFWEVVYEDPEFREYIKKRVLEDCASGDTKCMYWQDIPITRKKGGTTYITARNIPLPDSHLMVSTVWDVTEHNRAENALRSSELRYRSLFEASRDGIIILDAYSGIIIDINPFMIDIMGSSYESYRGKKIWSTEVFREIIPDKDKLTELRKKGYIRYEDIHIKTGNGRMIDVEFTGNVYKIDHKNVIQCNIRDITDRIRLQKSILKISAHQESLLSAIPDIIMETDINKVYTWANRSAFEFFGDDVIGKEAAFYFVGEQDTYKKIQPIFEGHEHVIYVESCQRRKDGENRLLTWWSRVLKNENGNVTGVISTARDITEEKKVEAERKHFIEELERSNLEFQQFAYVASHDLQEPLRMISSYLQLIERRYKDRLDEDANDFINFAVDGANRLKALIIGLLEYSRVTTHGKPFKEVNIKYTLDMVIKSLEIQINESGADVEYKDMPVIIADETQISRLFQNLIQNSIKFRREGIKPYVKISSMTSLTEYLFCVSDNSMGIEQQYFDSIFTIFQRLHARDEYPGTGLGLSICKKIVERHGGKIWVESKFREGSSFYFTIPAGIK